MPTPSSWGVSKLTVLQPLELRRESNWANSKLRLPSGSATSGPVASHVIALPLLDASIEPPRKRPGISGVAPPSFSGGETSSQPRPSGRTPGDGSVVNVFGDGTPSTVPEDGVVTTTR